MPTTGPTPITADGRLTMLYTSAGIQHKLRLRCQIDHFTTPDWYLKSSTGTPVKASDAADEVFTLLAGLYKSGTSSFDGWELDKYVSGAYLPQQAGATAITPSDSAAVQVAQQVTVTFRDDNFKKVRFIFLEQRTTPAAKYSYGQLGGEYLALVNSIIGETSSDIGRWYCGRGDADTNSLSYVSLVSTYNRKLRRRRGLS